MLRSRQCLLLAVLLALTARANAAQVRVNPTGVNVDAQGATSVFLTFGGTTGYEPVEAFWCGALVPAAPDAGQRCDPATLFGSLPARFDRSLPSGTGGFTDVMTIPPSVARRAYQAAEGGAESAFFYVRRFRSLAGGPDEYVAVTCRMTGGGARTPLSLTDVRLDFIPDQPLLYLAPGVAPPAVEAQLTYTGTGRLQGRWEVVLPGEELPTATDLLTEATLPLELRGSQRRYAQLSRFSLFLPPTGHVVLPGPDPARLPTGADGAYTLLLRIEASSEKEGDSDLGAAGAGAGVVPGGAVAGFPLPVLRYIVGSGSEELALEPASGVFVTQLLPGPEAAVPPDSLRFTWRVLARAQLYRVEIQSDSGAPLLTGLLPGTAGAYAPPPWLRDRSPAGVRWRVTATDAGGRPLARSGWRLLRWRQPPA